MFRPFSHDCKIVAWGTGVWKGVAVVPFLSTTTSKCKVHYKWKQKPAINGKNCSIIKVSSMQIQSETHTKAEICRRTLFVRFIKTYIHLFLFKKSQSLRNWLQMHEPHFRSHTSLWMEVETRLNISLYVVLVPASPLVRSVYVEERTLKKIK